VKTDGQPSDPRPGVGLSDRRNGSKARPAEDSGVSDIELVLPEGRAFDAVGRLVAAGVGTRAGLRVDRIEDLQLALEAFRHRPGAPGVTRMRFCPAEAGVRVEVSPLGGLESDRALERVLSTLVDEVGSLGAGRDRRISLTVANGSVAEGR
jgi:hypothetical protein